MQQSNLIGGKGDLSLAQFAADRLSFARLCEKLNLSRVAAGGTAGKYTFWECPFHVCPLPADASALSGATAATATTGFMARHPLRVQGDRSFECAACGRSGDVLDFYAEVNGFANPTLAAVHLLSHAPEIPKNWRLQARGGGYRPSSESEAGWLYLQPPAGGRVGWAAVKNAMDSLYHHPVGSNQAIRSLLDFARQKRWMADEIAAGNPYPVGIGPDMTFAGGAEPCATLQFPKLLLTRRSSRFYGLSDATGTLCGVKYRLAPEGERSLRTAGRGRPVSPWTFSGDYPQSMAWEFDQNEDAPCLFVCIGPGSGVALYHEAWRNSETADRFGSKWHIMGFDSFFNLSSLSLVRRVVEGETLSLFDGYRYIWLVVGADGLGTREESLARIGASIIKGQNQTAQVGLLRLSTESVDTFFEEGGRISDFALLAKIAETV